MLLFLFLFFAPERGRHPTECWITPLTERHIVGQNKVTVTTEDVLGCLNSNFSVLTLKAQEVWLSLTYTGETNSSLHIPAPSTCWLQVRGRSHGVMSMLIFNVTCLADNQLVVHSPMWNRHSFDCDPTIWVAPGMELTMTSDLANISIEINDPNSPFSLHALFKTFQQREPQKMEIRQVTRYLGMLFF